MQYAYFRGFPRRHLRSSLWSLLWMFVVMGLFLGLAGAGLWLNVRFLLEERHWKYALLAVFPGVMTYFFGKGLIEGIGESFHGSIFLYFERRVGFAKRCAGGAALARNCQRLDELAVTAGCQPLSYFGFEDNYRTREILDWRPASEGLATFDALMRAVPMEVNFPDATAILKEAAECKAALLKAEELSIRFRLLLRHGQDGMVSPLEFVQGKGSFS